MAAAKAEEEAKEGAGKAWEEKAISGREECWETWEGIREERLAAAAGEVPGGSASHIAS